MTVLFYLVLFIVLSISGKDKKKDAKVIFNVLFPKTFDKAKSVKKEGQYTTNLIKEIGSNAQKKKKKKTQEKMENFHSLPGGTTKNFYHDSATKIKTNVDNDNSISTNNNNNTNKKKKINNEQSIDDSFIQNEDIDWKVQEESEKGENFKKIADSVVHASNNKSFKINLEDVVVLKKSDLNSSINSFQKDLSKKENHDDFFSYYKYDDKLKYEAQKNEIVLNVKKIESQFLNEPKNVDPIKQTNKNVLVPIKNLKIRVSFISEKKKKFRDDSFDEESSQKEKIKKRVSKLRRLRNFSFKRSHIFVVDDKYFLDSFFPFFSITRYDSVSSPKLKRILILSLTFQVYMMISGLFFYKVPLKFHFFIDYY